MELTTPHGRRSQCLAVVHVIGRQISEVDGTDDAVGLMTRPLQNVDLSLQRPCELLAIWHHPESGP